MQKIEKKASILIWSIFLSLIVSTVFLSISTKINKSLHLNKNYINSISIENALNQATASGIFETIEIDKNTDIVFEDLNAYKLSLTHEEKVIYNYPVSGNNLTITINSGGPLYYQHSTSSGIITSSTILNFNAGSLSLTNLGGGANILLESSTNPIPVDFIGYQIIRYIGGQSYVLKDAQLQINNF